MSTTPKTIAIDILSRRDNSIREMRQKLKRKKISEEDIEETIGWLMEKKLLDDHTFAQKKAESIFRIKLCGPKYIENKLREAGIASDIIDVTLENLASQEDWDTRAQKAITQWQQAHLKHADDKVRKMRFLISRGFTSAAVS